MTGFQLAFRISVLSLMCWLSTPAAAQSSDAPPPEVTLASRIDSFPARLERLSEQNPRAYFELGEEAASEAASPLERQLARRLFVLAFDLERKRPQKDQDGGLLASACLALASMADTEGDRRWLRAMASVFAPTAAAIPNSTGESSVQTVHEVTGGLDAATVLGLARAGEGRKAARILDRPAALEALLRNERLLSPSLMLGGLDRVRSIIEQWPVCPLCRNRRSVKDASGVHLCSYCLGKPGPRISEEELVYQLRTEAVLLSGTQRSWGAASMVDAGAPLRDTDPDELAPTLGVDVSHPIFKAGRWLASTNEKPEAKTGSPSKPGNLGMPRQSP